MEETLEYKGYEIRKHPLIGGYQAFKGNYCTTTDTIERLKKGIDENTLHMMRVKRDLPRDVQDDMELWRKEFTIFPKSYIKWNEAAAYERIDEMKTEYPGLQIHKTYIENDGWLDGMKVLIAIMEYKDIIFRMKWNDSSQDFMFHSPTGGYMSSNPEEIAKTFHDGYMMKLNASPNF